jgi:hypothetical protein
MPRERRLPPPATAAEQCAELATGAGEDHAATSVVGRQTDGSLMASSVCGEVGMDQQEVVVGVGGRQHPRRG